MPRLSTTPGAGTPTSRTKRRWGRQPQRHGSRHNIMASFSSSRHKNDENVYCLCHMRVRSIREHMTFSKRCGQQVLLQQAWAWS
jgi:hypothetical protein